MLKVGVSGMASGRYLDRQLWHAIAGGMVRIPPVDSKVCYFPEGHAEQASSNVDLSCYQKMPSLIPCKVASLRYMADDGDDEVFVRMKLVPVAPIDHGDGGGGGKDGLGGVVEEKVASFAKTLTQSDANNGGGFSVPRYCAETIFPKLDYKAEPPVQTVVVRDVHGELWRFRHIYRGTPRRHLLTTGWSNFVNRKRLVAGDSVVFLRKDGTGDLCIGIRRGRKRGFCCSPPPPPLAMVEGGGGGGEKVKMGSNGWKGRVSSVAVKEAVGLAVSGKPFEVTYYPRGGTPEFCVGISAVADAMKVRWVTGMRFKMAFETEDSSRISWFMGIVAGTRASDHHHHHHHHHPLPWLNSPWRFLKVTWDEPDLLENVKSVNPWLVEQVPNISALHATPFLPPLKKMCLPRQSEPPLNNQISTPIFSSNSLLQSSGPACYPPGYALAGIQGARHAQLHTPQIDTHQNKLQQSLFLAGTQGLDDGPPPTAITVKSTVDEEKVSHFILFGKLIVAEKQSSSGSSMDTSRCSTDAYSSSEGGTENANFLDGSASAIHQHGQSEEDGSAGSPHYKHPKLVELENTSVSAFKSPDKLKSRLGGLFWDQEIGSSSWRALQRSS